MNILLTGSALFCLATASAQSDLGGIKDYLLGRTDRLVAERRPAPRHEGAGCLRRALGRRQVEDLLEDRVDEGPAGRHRGRDFVEAVDRPQAKLQRALLEVGGPRGGERGPHSGE